jgi:hypothetical protein
MVDQYEEYVNFDEEIDAVNHTDIKNSNENAKTG